MLSDVLAMFMLAIGSGLLAHNLTAFYYKRKIFNIEHTLNAFITAYVRCREREKV